MSEPVDPVEVALQEWTREQCKRFIQKYKATNGNRSPRDLIPIITKHLETEGCITCPLAKDLYGFEGDNSTFKKCIIKKIREAGLTIHEKMEGRTKLYYTDKHIPVDPQTKPPFKIVSPALFTHLLVDIDLDLPEHDLEKCFIENPHIYPAYDKKKNKKSILQNLQKELAKHGYEWTARLKFRKK